MFERFTDRARRTLVLAQEESKALGHNFIGTEHILLGLAAEGEGVAHVALSALGIDTASIRSEVHARVPAQWQQPAVADALATLGIDLDRVRSEIEGTFGEGALQSVDRTPFTPKAKAVLEAALAEAVALGHDYIGTEHLLLGLTTVPDGLAVDIVHHFGTTPDALRHMALAVLTSARHLAGKPALVEVRAIEDAVRVLPPDQREAAKRVVRDVIYPARAAAFVTIAADANDDTVREQTRLIAAASEEAVRRFDELEVGSFVRRARLLLDHPVQATVHTLTKAVNLLAVALQSERFTPQQVSVATAARRRAIETTDAMWNAVWRDREVADDAALLVHLFEASAEMAGLLERLGAFAARALLNVDEGSTDT